MNNKTKYKLWGNAFEEAVDSLVFEFTASHDVFPIPAADVALIPFDIKCNKAHIKMLGKQKLISKKEMAQLLGSLEELSIQYHKGAFKLDANLEDVHTNIENWIAQNYGKELAGKIHTGRSRNDQVTTDMFLYLHDEIEKFILSIEDLITTLSDASNKYAHTVCPGFTHHQHATVTSFGLILQSFLTAFERDLISFKDIKSKYNYSPLGACVGYGSLMDIDAEFSAKELGFNAPFKNSIDVISNRGEFEAAFAFCKTQFLNHASNLAQTFILFSTTEFGFIKLADKYSTGSSAMPQKKNPDPLEVIKGLACVANGNLNSLLQINKGNFIGYNRDGQESKYLIYHLIHKSKTIPLILKGIIKTLKVFPNQMESQANKGFINSMGLMEILVTKYKLPMRQSKVLIEKSIKLSIALKESNKVLYKAFTKALKDSNIQIKVNKNEFLKWQDAEFQLNKLLQKA